MTASRLARLALAATLAAVAAAAWVGYGRPDFVLWLGSSLLLCT
jgi:hypothetical protein